MLLHELCRITSISHSSVLSAPLAEPLSGVLAEEDSQDSPRLGVAQGEPLKGDQDLLTCGQCHSRFPLADILLFIEHKRRQCHGSLCTDKPLDRPPSSPLASPLSTSSSHSRSHHQHPRRVCHPVEVAIQVSPQDEDCLSAPLQGIIPKQENITGKHTRSLRWLPHTRFLAVGCEVSAFRSLQPSREPAGRPASPNDCEKRKQTVREGARPGHRLLGLLLRRRCAQILWPPQSLSCGAERCISIPGWRTTLPQLCAGEGSL